MRECRVCSKNGARFTHQSGRCASPEMKTSVGLSLCFFAAGVQAFVGHAPLLQPRSLWRASSSPSAAKAAVPAGRREDRVVVTRMGWGDDVVFSKVRTSMIVCRHAGMLGQETATQQAENV